MCFQTDIPPYLQNYELCIQHLKNFGLLPRSLNCPICKNCLFWTRYKKSKMVLAGSVKTEIVRNSKVFFLFAREVFSPKALFNYQNGYI